MDRENLIPAVLSVLYRANAPERLGEIVKAEASRTDPDFWDASAENEHDEIIKDLCIPRDWVDRDDEQRRRYDEEVDRIEDEKSYEFVEQWTREELERLSKFSERQLREIEDEIEEGEEW